MNRFWEKVDKSGDCHEWLAGKDKDGYGKFKIDGKTKRAHRFVLDLVGPGVPDDMHVCHTCDNPGCVNPDHLFIGTPQDNYDDMARKGRRADRRGTNHPMARFTEDQVRKVRAMRDKGDTIRKIAQIFGVSTGAIDGIVYGANWKEVA